MTSKHELEALRLDPKGYAVERGHTLASAIAACIAPLASTTPEQASGLAVESLRALAGDLHMLWYAVNESYCGKGEVTLNESDVVEWIYRLAQRAEGAADLCGRIEHANEERAATPVEKSEPNVMSMNQIDWVRDHVEAMAECVDEIEEGPMSAISMDAEVKKWRADFDRAKEEALRALRAMKRNERDGIKIGAAE